MNEALILTATYFMPAFSDWVTDVEARYSAGFALMYIIAVVAAVNFIIICVEMCKGVEKAREKTEFLAKVKRLHE